MYKMNPGLLRLRLNKSVLKSTQEKMTWKSWRVEKERKKRKVGKSTKKHDDAGNRTSVLLSGSAVIFFVRSGRRELHERQRKELGGLREAP